MISERESIIAAVGSAFAGVLCEGGITLHESLAMDGNGDAEALAEARALDADVPWTDIPAEDISLNPEIFAFLDFKGYRYYLPAYMDWSLRHFDSSDSASSDDVIYALNPQGPPWNVRLSYFERFSDEQKAVVARFLRFMATQNRYADTVAASEALKNYWGNFEESRG